MENKTDNLWGIRDLIFISLCTVLFTVAVSFAFFGVVKENPYAGAFIIDVLLLLAVFMLCRRKRVSWNQFGFVREHRIRALVFGGVIGILLPTSVVIFKLDFVSVLTRIEAGHFAYMLIHPVTFNGFTGIFLTPFVEEVCTRGILYRVVRNRFGPLVSISLVSCIFSLLHASSLLNLEHFIIRFFYSAVLSYIFERNGNMYQCISCHIAINYITAFYRVV